MLLLVLVLVLIAFGLLVVALLSGSALWAWVSVGVSVVAAGVLLVDWLQRRAAVRGAEDHQPAQAAAPSWSSYDADPVTEQIPVIRPESITAADQFASAETVGVSPVAEPSVSHQQPSSAPPWLPRSRDLESQRVAESGNDPSAESPPPPRYAPPVDHADAAGRANGAEAIDPPTVAQQSQPGVDDADVDETTAVKSPAASPVAATSSAPPPDDAPAAAADPPTTAIGDPPTTAIGEPLTTAMTASPAAGKPAAPKATAKRADAAAGPATDASAKDEADDASAEAKTSMFERPETTNDQTVVFPVSADTEPPEEPRDPGNAALVAELVDVVVVIDERPRYHVTGCRFLPGRTEIPLPVNEAVELGFTPCGWCNPDQTLSNKHRATSSH